MARARDPVGGSRGVWSPPPLSLAPPVAAVARQKKSPAHADGFRTSAAYDSLRDWSGPDRPVLESRFRLWSKSPPIGLVFFFKEAFWAELERGLFWGF
jgi:hypothetical protein